MMMKQYDNGTTRIVYLNGRRATIDDLYAFFEDYNTFGKQIVTQRFSAGRYVFIETRT